MFMPSIILAGVSGGSQNMTFLRKLDFLKDDFYFGNLYSVVTIVKKASRMHGSNRMYE